MKKKKEIIYSLLQTFIFQHNIVSCESVLIGLQTLIISYQILASNFVWFGLFV